MIESKKAAETLKIRFKLTQMSCSHAFCHYNQTV